MLRSDRGAQAFPTAKDRQNKDSIPHMVVEFILKHRNISAVFYFIKAHLVRLQVTWYAMVNYLTQEWKVAICHALSSRGKKPIVYGIPYLMTLTNIQLIRAIALVIMPTSPQEFMRLLSESKSTTPRPNPARFLSHDAVYDYNISELQRGLEEYSILCVGNTHWESIKLDFSRDRDLFNDDGKPAYTGLAALICARLVGVGMKNLKQFIADPPTYTHEAKKPLFSPPYFGSIRKIKSMDHLITCLTLLCQFFHDLSKEYKITQSFFEGADPIVYHQETPQDNVRESNRRYPRAKAHTTIATDEGSSEDEPYPNYDEAQEILHAIESREAKGDLSCQPCFLVFHRP
jgi:hypothetical protein